MRDADAVARSLGSVAGGLSVTDELYDVTTYATSSIFDDAQVLASSSTRSGEVTYAFGLERLAAVREGLASALLADARGSIIQEAAGANAVTSWRRYGAFGDVTAGTDAQERSFFGYNGEEQSPVTGLIYLRARYYDSSNARFGVPDTYLGNAFSPLTLNRYLYCNSDPVNYIDPSGHLLLSVTGGGLKNGLGVLGSNFLAYDYSHPNWYKKPGGTRINGDSFAKLPGQLTTPSDLLPINAPAWQKRMHATINTNLGLGQEAMRRGDLEAAKRYFGAASVYITRYQAIYCGSNKYLKEINAQAKDFSDNFGWIPVAGAYSDVLYYATAGDGTMLAISSVIFTAEVFTFGSASLAKSGGKIALGAGLKAAAKSSVKGAVSDAATKERIPSTAPGMGGQITNTIVRGDKTITFKHGDRHADEIGLSPDVIEEAIADDVASMTLDQIKTIQGKKTIQVNGETIKYGVRLLDDGTINVGTYHK